MVSISEEIKATIAKCEKAGLYSSNPAVKKAQIKAQKDAITNRGY